MSKRIWNQSQQSELEIDVLFASRKWRLEASPLYFRIQIVVIKK